MSRLPSFQDLLKGCEPDKHGNYPDEFLRQPSGLSGLDPNIGTERPRVLSAEDLLAARPSIRQSSAEWRPAPLFHLLDRPLPIGHLHPSRNMETPMNETFAEYHRSTVTGRKLVYKLQVLQQPERARACGAGRKSSADRRPVDPPPVVKLQIFEESADGHRMDITSTHNATFVMYASLKLARKIAHPNKMPGPPDVAVLTGQHVAATNYLERPDPAGYFIFPDLSVRHEGHYRIVFALYEQVKERKDADIDRPIPEVTEPARSSSPTPPRQWDGLQHRLEVCTAPFQVFSAKKFPGLAESTSLSKHLADQGCRVRIRRDVRMRKRKEPTKEYDEIHAGYAIPEEYGPRTPIERQRSVSVARSYHSHHSDGHPMIDYAQEITGPAMAPPSFHPNSYTGYPTMTPQYPVPAHRQNPPTPISTSTENLNRRSSGSSQTYWQSHPSPRILPPAIEPDPALTQSSTKSNSLPPIRSLDTGMQKETPVDQQCSNRQYDPLRRQFVMPEATPSKRAHSPTYGSSSAYIPQPMKSGMRPDTAPPPSNTTNRQFMTGAIQADNNPYDDDDGGFGDLHHTLMRYRRADGKESNRTIRTYSPSRY